ncbi:MAG: hypothetical protein IJ424_02755 [Oscillospiraceae bacterium]|nr:hypothetical protein [Oscillospiraceae bacterium]
MLSRENFHALKLLCIKAKFVLQEGKFCDRIDEEIGYQNEATPIGGFVLLKSRQAVCHFSLPGSFKE